MAVKRDFDFWLKIVLVLGILAGGVVAWIFRPANPLTTSFSKSKEAALPSVSFTDNIGRTITLEQFKGQVILVNLWATWCPPCVVELPSLDKLQAKLHTQNFKVIAIAMQQDAPATLQSFFEQKDIEHLALYQDSNREILMKWHYQGLPMSFLIDREGHLVKTYEGAKTWDEGTTFQEIQALLKPSGKLGL